MARIKKVRHTERQFLACTNARTVNIAIHVMNSYCNMGDDTEMDLKVLEVRRLLYEIQSYAWAKIGVPL